jgi:hypothetical protein
MDLNLLVLHCYTGGARRYVNYVEPMVRVEYRGVLPEAAFDTSLTARWGYRPLRVSEFVFGTGSLFTPPPGADAFGSPAALLPKSNVERYEHAQRLIRKVIAMAHDRDIEVAMGFEFGVYPPELFSIIPNESYIAEYLLPDPTHPASIEILQGTLNGILRDYPEIDQVWLWLQEHSVPVKGTPFSEKLRGLYEKESGVFDPGLGESSVFSGVWASEYICQAHAYMSRRAPRVRLAISGWGSEDQLTGVLAGLHKAVSSDIVFTCLNPGQGHGVHPAVFQEITKTREVWAIPWLEGDRKLWHPQPRVKLLREQVRRAARDKLDGVIAIHWRTEDIEANREAFATIAADPARAPSVAGFYRAYARRLYGHAAERLAPLLTRMDEEEWFQGM